MKDIEHYLNCVCRSVRGSSSLVKHLREELREHLLEAIERHTAAGVSHEEAVTRSIEEFGTPEEVSEGLQAVYGRRMVSVLIEKAMAWRERTMKTGWKWSFVAHCTLILTCTVAFLLIAGTVTFITPLVEKEYSILERPVPEYLGTLISVLRFLHDWSIVGFAVLVLAWVVFERRFTGENKSIVRLASGGVVCLGLTVMAGLTIAFTVVPLGLLPGIISHERAETVAARKVVQAETAFRQLEAVVQTEEPWPANMHAAERLSEAFESLRDRAGLAVPALAVIHKRKELDRIRNLVRTIEELSEDVRDAAESDAIKKRFSRLRESYEKLTALIEGWPAEKQTQPVNGPQG